MEINSIEIWTKTHIFFAMKMHLKMLSAKHRPFCSGFNMLTHWGWVTQICVGKLTNIGSNNGLSPGRRQAIIWTNAGILLIGPLGTNFSEFLIVIHTFSFSKMHLKISSAKWRPFCLSLNVLTLLVLKLGHSGRSRSIPWLLMPWLLVSPGHQQPWHWPCRINRSLSSMGKIYNYRKTSSISRTKSQSLTVSCVLLHLSSLNLLKPDAKLRMKM